MNKLTLSALVALTQGMRVSQQHTTASAQLETEPAQLAQMPDVESLVMDLSMCFEKPTEPVSNDWALTMQRCQRDALARDWELAQSLSRPDYQKMVGMLRMKLNGGEMASDFDTKFDTFNLFLARQHYRRTRRAQPDDM